MLFFRFNIYISKTHKIYENFHFLLKKNIILMNRKLKTSLSHTHPLAYIQQPDILNQDRSSVIDIVTRILYAALPTIICFQLNIITTVINIYFVGNYGSLEYAIGIGIGAVIIYMIGFMLLQSMNMGFAAACVNLVGLPNSQKAIGLMYQKALGVNFFLCILITPFLYLSDKVLLKIGLSHNIVLIASQYIWGLVPSFYLYCFYDTTRNYLQSQGRLYPPLIIQAFSSLVHFILAWIFIKQMNNVLSGAIWAKNISDALNSLLLYFYIVKWEPTKETWIQWSIQAATNWTIFIQIILSMGISTFFQTLAYQIITVIASHLDTYQMIYTHLIISFTILLIYLAALGISHCITYAFYSSLRDNKVNLAKKKLSVGILIMFCFSAVTMLELKFHKEQWKKLFTSQQTVIQLLEDIFPIMLIVIFLESMQICLGGFLRSMDMSQKVLKVYIWSFYIVGISSSILLAFYNFQNVKGIWIGWLLGQLMAIIWFLIIIFKIDWDDINSQLEIREQKLMKETKQSIRQQVQQQSQSQQQSKKRIKEKKKKKTISKYSSQIQLVTINPSSNSQNLQKK